MQIIERKDPSQDSYQQECPRCGSLLSWTESDVQKDKDGVYLECAVCGMFFTPDTSNPVPPNDNEG